MIQSEHHDSLDRIRVNAKTLPYGAENCWNNWDGCYEAAAYNHILIFGFCRIKESLKWIDLKMEKNEIQHVRPLIGQSSELSNMFMKIT